MAHTSQTTTIKDLEFVAKRSVSLVEQPDPESISSGLLGMIAVQIRVPAVGPALTPTAALTART
jgi:hypothetical protein